VLAVLGPADRSRFAKISHATTWPARVVDDDGVGVLVVCVDGRERAAMT
jgi:hypothetical protein